jgi:Flp pilus assembly protein TadD
MAQGDLAGAATQMAMAVQLDPEDAVAHAALAVVRLRQQRFHEAEASLRQALGLRPAEADFHMNLGVALRMLGKPDEAIGSLRVALLLRPAFVEARVNLAVTLLAGDPSFYMALMIKMDMIRHYMHLHPFHWLTRRPVFPKLIDLLLLLRR